MGKYYAVKVGKTTGIFENWDECKESVTGYPGATYKSFKNINEAYEYMEWENVSTPDSSTRFDHISTAGESEIDITSRNPNCAIAYVDGSFNIDTNIFSYGLVMFYNGSELHMSESYSDEKLASMRNVAGEIFGSMAAMKFAINNNIEEIFIYHDYEGISKWPLGQWKANKEGTIDYKHYYDSIKDRLKVNFIKVKGHSGDKYNDLADKLAKQAAGIS